MRIKGTLTLELIHGEARHTQTVPVLGSVQVPLSLVPARLVLMPGVVQEVQVRNTTQDAVRIAEVLMPADFLVSEWAAGKRPDRTRQPFGSKNPMGRGADAGELAGGYYPAASNSTLGRQDNANDPGVAKIPLKPLWIAAAQPPNDRVAGKMSRKHNDLNEALTPSDNKVVASQLADAMRQKNIT